jgi:hypothetical protein
MRVPFIQFIVAVSALFLLSMPLVRAATGQAHNEQVIIEELFKKILDQGFSVALPSLEEITRQVEIHGDQAVFSIPVTLKTTDAARETLNAATKQFGGQAMEAFFEADYGIVSWEAHAVRVSKDPGTLEYFQRRIGSMAFSLRLILEDHQIYECQTRDVWRLPMAPVRQLFAFGGRAAIQGLGISPMFDTTDYGFIATRKNPISFLYRGTVTAAEFAKIVKIEGRMVDGKGTADDSDCRKRPRS